MTSIAGVKGMLWPLRLGETLSNHDWWPFAGHQFLRSSLVNRTVLEGRRGDLGTAIILRAEAMRGDPAGTLPVDDVDLASLARFHSVAAWQAVKAGVLEGWAEVDVVDELGERVQRLGHLDTLSVVADMMERSKARAAGRTGNVDRQKMRRIRGKLRGLGLPRHISDSADIQQRLLRHFTLSGLFVTDQNVQAALAEVINYTGDVIPLGRGHMPAKSNR